MEILRITAPRKVKQESPDSDRGTDRETDRQTENNEESKTKERKRQTARTNTDKWTREHQTGAPQDARTRNEKFGTLKIFGGSQRLQTLPETPFVKCFHTQLILHSAPG
jgi:hypothetical protein